MAGMRPRPWGVLAAALAALTSSALLAVAMGGGAQAAPQQQPAKPNIVVVMTDDQTVESLRVMANVNTLLARQGVTFSNNFASYPLCCPSRATFITGQYGHNHTIMGNAAPTGGYDKFAPTHSNSLPAWLQQAGYTTVHLGKYLNGYGRTNPTAVPPGWSEWYGSIDPTTYRFYNYRLNENGRLVDYGTGAANYQADVYNRKAVDIVRRLAATPKPFFLSVAFLAPHTGGPRDPDDPPNLGTPSPAPRHRNAFANQPLPAPPSLNEADMSDKPAAMRNRPVLSTARLNAIREHYQQRLESLLAVDEAVRDLLSALQAANVLQRTYVIFTADNGFFHGEHRVATGKVLVYEPSVRVPLIIRGPGIPRGVTRTNLTANVDLAPTILDIAGARAARRLDGRTLLPFARDARRRSGRDILLETTTYSAIRTPRHVFVQHSTGEQELYDLVIDPHQLTSLHADARYAALKNELARRLTTLRTCAGDACRKGPDLRLSLRYRRGSRGCARSSVRLRVGGSAASRISSVVFYRGSRAIKSDRRAPYTATVRRSRLGRRNPSLLRALVTLNDARSASLDRALRRCR
jgi:N-acetylglucosamine-6-sulfatase